MDAVMIRYGELFLKSESVMRYYIEILLNNLKKALDAEGLEYKLELFRGRLLVEGDKPEEIARVASRIFGIVGVSLCTRTSNDREDIESRAVDIAVPKVKAGMTFAVKARRSGVKGFSSQELAASIGSKIYDTVPGLTVDLKHPEYELSVEARSFGGLIYDNRIAGPGGLPLGTQGRVLSLLSAGIDSPVASWLMMRRGCKVTHLHLDGGSYMGTDIREAVLEHHKVLSTWCKGYPLHLIVANMEPFYSSLEKTVTLKNRCIVCKRFMLRMASKIAEHENACALVMGDNIGQVASQTLVNIGVVESVLPAHLPLIQPLITNDKQETVTLARYIGTFREYAGDHSCHVVPKHPAIAASIEDVIADEEKLDIEQLLETCLKTVHYYKALNGKIEEI